MISFRVGVGVGVQFRVRVIVSVRVGVGKYGNVNLGLIAGTGGTIMAAADALAVL